MIELELFHIKKFFQTLFYKIIKRLITWLQSLSNKLEKKVTKEKSLQNSLAPKLLVGQELEKIEPYVKRIDDGINQPDINNIALMGTYGSGKSTILKNFEILHPEHKFLNLSLGSYSKKEGSKEGSQAKAISNDDDLSEKLENSLVKQMIYREKNSKLPYSRFKKINHISLKKLAMFFLLVMCSITSLLYLKDFLNFKKILVSNSRLIRDNISVFDLTFYSIFLIGLFVIMFLLFQVILRQFKLSKLNFANVSIESNENNFSYFNKYIDEILYYFESSKFNVVVIEDVDRFKSIKVFEHLKELNLLLNNSKQIDRNITFIYAVKEDIFSKSEEDIEEKESELRTKFFELIIPIIPVVDTFNSRDYLIPMMAEKQEKKLTKNFVSFLKDISLYIDDLRLLTNIVNEYYTYLEIHKNLSGSMNEESLFSIITLKNLIPSAFTDLQKSQGLIYDLLVQGLYNEFIIQDIEHEIEKIKVGFKEIEDQIELDKISETKKFLFDQGISSENKIILNGQYRVLSAINKELIEEIIDGDDFISGNDKYGYDKSFNKSGLIGIIKGKDKILNDLKESKQKEYDRKRDEIDNFYRLSFQEKLSRFPNLINCIFKTQESSYYKDKDLILFLLSNGYIAEDYSTYLSIFYEERSLSSDDKKILVKLKSNQKIEFDGKISNISGVVDELLIQDYEKQGILNINILMYLFSNDYEDNHGVRDIILEKLCNQPQNVYLQCLNIILSYEKERIANLIFELVRKFKSDFFDMCEVERRNELQNIIFYSCLGENTNFSVLYNKEDRKNVLFNLLNQPVQEWDEEAEDYTDVYDYVFSENILSRSNFFVEVEEYVNFEKVMSLFYEHNNSEVYVEDESKIYFKDLNIQNFSWEMFEKFVDYELFEFEPTIISKILNYGNEEEKKPVSYNQVLLSGIDTFISYIESNIDLFIENVLLRLENMFETEESFLNLLNFKFSSINTEKYNSLKFKLIEKSNVSTIKLAAVNETLLWRKILEERKCIITWENLKSYYDSEHEDFELIKSVFNCVADLNALKMDYQVLSDEGKKTAEELLSTFVDNRVIDVTDVNIELLKITTYNADDLNEKDIRILVDNHLVNFNLETVDIFIKYNLIVDIILDHPNEFIANYKELTLSSSNLIRLIKQWNDDPINDLLNLITEEESDELFENTELIDVLIERKIISSDKLFLRLINNKNPRLKKYFIQNLKQHSLSKNVIENSLISFHDNNIVDFTNDEYNCIFENLANNELFVKLLNQAFINSKINSDSIDHVIYWVQTQNSPISELYINQNSEVKLKKTLENEQLLKNLRRIGIVSKFNEVEGDYFSVYNKRKYPPKKKY